MVSNSEQSFDHCSRHDLSWILTSGTSGYESDASDSFVEVQPVINTIIVSKHQDLLKKLDEPSTAIPAFGDVSEIPSRPHLGVDFEMNSREMAADLKNLFDQQQMDIGRIRETLVSLIVFPAYPAHHWHLTSILMRDFTRQHGATRSRNALTINPSIMLSFIRGYRQLSSRPRFGKQESSMPCKPSKASVTWM